jgi:hypothetical protein
MKGLRKPVALPTAQGVFILSLTEHIAVLFQPRRVMDLGHDGLHISAIPVVTVVEAHGIETNAKVSEMGKKTDRPFRAFPQPLLHKISDRLIKWNAWVAQMISPTEIGQIHTAPGPEPAVLEQGGKFLQIEVQHKQPVLKAV